MKCKYLFLLLLSSFFTPICGMKEEDNVKNPVDLVKFTLESLKKSHGESITLPNKDVRSLINEIVKLRKENEIILKQNGNNYEGDYDEDTISEVSGLDPFVNGDDYIAQLIDSKPGDKVNSFSNFVVYIAGQFKQLKNNHPQKVNKSKRTKLPRSVSSGSLNSYQNQNLEEKLEELSQQLKASRSRQEEQFSLLRTYVNKNVENEIKNLALDIENLKKRLDGKHGKKPKKHKSLGESNKPKYTKIDNPDIEVLKRPLKTTKRNSLRGSKKNQKNPENLEDSIKRGKSSETIVRRKHSHGNLSLIPDYQSTNTIPKKQPKSARKEDPKTDEDNNH